MLALTVSGLSLGAVSSAGASMQGDGDEDSVPVHVEGIGDAKDESEGDVAQKDDAKTPDNEKTAPAWSQYPNTCETFTVIEGDTRFKNRKGQRVYPVRHKRNRYERTGRDQRRTRKLIRLVAKEMGADEDAQYLVDMIAHHESSWNPYAIHILNEDLNANFEAWERHAYDAGREQKLLARMEEVGARASEYWQIKAELADLRLYKGNTFWDKKLAYQHVIPERTLHKETTPAQEFTEHRSVWAYGYGLYGMNAVLYTHWFDREAPPWMLCADEGIVATVTLIWALREQQEDCRYLSKDNPGKWGESGGSARGVIRRFARGQCNDRRLGPAWRRIMKDYDRYVAWEKEPDFGENFTRFETHRRGGELKFRYEMEVDPETGKKHTKRDERGRKIKIPADREAILAHMHEKAARAGLLRERPLERDDPSSDDKVVIATYGMRSSE